MAPSRVIRLALPGAIDNSPAVPRINSRAAMLAPGAATTSVAKPR
jgi:hypothetical protein